MSPLSLPFLNNFMKNWRHKTAKMPPTSLHYKPMFKVHTRRTMVSVVRREEVLFGLEMVKLGFISGLVGNAAEVSGLSAAMYTLTASGMSGLGGAQISLGSRHGNLNFCRVIYFPFLSSFCSRSHFYIRDSGGTTATPCAWPEDHGRGRFYATYLARMRHCGCRISFPERPHRSGLAWQVAKTYVTWRGDFHDYLTV